MAQINIQEDMIKCAYILKLNPKLLCYLFTILNLQKYILYETLKRNYKLNASLKQLVLSNDLKVLKFCCDYNDCGRLHLYKSSDFLITELARWVGLK